MADKFRTVYYPGYDYPPGYGIKTLRGRVWDYFGPRPMGYSSHKEAHAAAIAQGLEPHPDYGPNGRKIKRQT